MVAEEVVVAEVTKGGTQRRGGLRLRKVESVRNKGRLADLALLWSKLELDVAYLIRPCSLRQKTRPPSRPRDPKVLPLASPWHQVHLPRRPYMLYCSMLLRYRETKSRDSETYCQQSHEGQVRSSADTCRKCLRPSIKSSFPHSHPITEIHHSLGLPTSRRLSLYQAATKRQYRFVCPRTRSILISS